MYGAAGRAASADCWRHEGIACAFTQIQDFVRNAGVIDYWSDI